MKLNYYIEDNYEDLSKKTASLIIEHVSQNPSGLFCFAGGDTPVRTLQLLAQASMNGEVDFSQASFIELDEWVGIDPENHGSCFSYLKRNFWEPTGIREEQIHIFNVLNKDLDGECKKANEWIERHGNISLALLGVGVNGHIGFNEPGTPFSSKAHITMLDEVTQAVGGKYFNDVSNMNREKGITLGLGQLLQADQLLIQASGPKKKEAVLKVLRGEITETWPVTAIWRHTRAHLLVDKEVVSS